MFNDVGGKIQRFARILFVAGCVALVVAFVCSVYTRFSSLDSLDSLGNLGNGLHTVESVRESQAMLAETRATVSFGLLSDLFWYGWGFVGLYVGKLVLYGFGQMVSSTKNMEVGMYDFFKGIVSGSVEPGIYGANDVMAGVDRQVVSDVKRVGSRFYENR